MMTAIGYLLRALQVIGIILLVLGLVAIPPAAWIWLGGNSEGAPLSYFIIGAILFFCMFIKDKGPVEIGRRRDQLRSRNAEDVHPIR